jgi:hypothetical protein
MKTAALDEYDLSILIEKVNKLEKRRRRSKLIGGLIVLLNVVFVFACVNSATKTTSPTTTITAEKFVLLDQQKNVRAELSVADGEPRLVFFDENQMRGLILAMDKTEPSLSFYSGKDRALKTSVSGNVVGISLTSYDADGSIGAHVSASWTSSVVFSSAEKGVRIELKKPGPHLEIIDDNGETLRTIF